MAPARAWRHVRLRVLTLSPASSPTRLGSTATPFFAGGGLVDEPNKLADGAHLRCRHSTIAATDGAEDRRLLFADDQKSDLPAAFDHRIGHGDADFGAAVRHGRHPALALVQYRLSREQRRRVPITAEAEQRDIEQRTLRIEHRRAISLLQYSLVAPRGILGRAIGRNRMNILRRHRHL